MKLTLWHGGRDLESNYREIKPSAKGQWEHGPGLYLTTHLDTAIKYSKGSKSLYRVDLDFDPSKSVGKVMIPLNNMVTFTKKFAKKSEQADIIERFERDAKRYDGKVVAETLVNLLLNNDALTTARTVDLAEFLVGHGVQYGVTRYGGRSETVVVVYDRKIIKKVTKISSKDAYATEEYEIDAPKFDHKGFVSESVVPGGFKAFLMEQN